MAKVLDREPVTAAEQDNAALQKLDAKIRDMAEDSAMIVGPDGEQLRLPASAFTVLAQTVHHMAQGRSVTLKSFGPEVSTYVAAELLNVSHEFLVGHLLGKELPCHVSGTFQSIKLDDVLVYRELRDQRELEAIQEMADIAQELGIYDMSERMPE